MPEVQNRRRQFIVNRGLQYKIMSTLVGVVIVIAILEHGFALLIAKMVGNHLAPQHMAHAFHGTVPQGFSWDVVWISALVTVILGTIAVLVLGLFYSHRIAGPLFNLKRMLAKASGGDLKTQMHIRAKDELHDVEEAFNEMLAGLNHRLDIMRAAVGDLPPTQRKKVMRALEEAFQVPASGEDTAAGVKS